MKKTLAIILTAILALSMLTVGISADDAATSVNPADILGDAAYTTTTVVSFDEADITSRWAPASNGARCSFELTDGINGKAIKMTPKDDTSEGTITIEEMDWSGYDGLLYWVDMSQLQYNPNNTAKGQTGGVAIRVTSNYVSGGYSWTRNTTEPVLQNFDIATYYQENGEWKKCANQDEVGNSLMNGERINLPEKYVGWVYIPFTSYISTKGADGVPVPGIYGDIGIGKIMLLTGPYTAADNQDKSILVDEIQLVKLGASGDTDPVETDPVETDPIETDPIETDPVETDPVDTTPDTTPDTSADTSADTSDDTDGEDKGGCGSAIGASVALVAAAVLGTAVVSKKRR